MSAPVELKTCKKGLHQYPVGIRRCPECRRKSQNACYARNPEQQRKASREWHKKNLERSRSLIHKWRMENVERNRELKKRWKIKHPDKINEDAAKRRAFKKQAIAPWANRVLIKQIYKECLELVKKTNIQHHVDHIYPLKSDWLCGLHVETNLQILTETENITKGNRVWPGQLDCQKGSIYAIFPKELTDLLND
jgi:hypothetical protein